MNRAADLVDAPLAVSLKLHAEVEVGNEVEGSQLVEKMAAVDRVHAPEHHVASGDRPDSVRIEEVSGMGLHCRSQAHFRDGAGRDVDLEALSAGVVHGGVQDPIEVLLLDAIGVHQDQRADAVPGQLFDEGAAGTRTADDADAQAAEAVERSRAKALRHAASELGDGRGGGAGRPERKVVADDVDRRQRVKPAVLVDQPADHASVAEHDGTGVRTVLRPGVNGGEERAVGMVIDGGEGRWMPVAVDLQDRQPVLACFLQERREHVGRPGDPVGLSLRAGLVRNRS